MTSRVSLRPFSLYGLLLFCCFLVPACKPIKTALGPQAKAGLLDLRKVDWSSPITLDGHWTLTWGALLRPNQSAATSYPTRPVKVPGSWSKKVQGYEKLSNKGFATYRLRILLPRKRPEPFMLHAHRVASAYELWVNGEMLTSRGQVSSTPSSSVLEIGSRLVPLPNADTLNLVVVVSNYQHRIGGLRRSWSIGRTSQMLADLRWDHLMHGMLPSIIFAIGCLFFALGGVRRDASWLWFAGFCLATSIRAAVGNDALTVRIVLPWIDTIGQLRLEYISNFGVLTCTIGLLAAMFRKQTPWRISQIAMACMLAFTLGSAILPLNWVLRSLPLFGLSVLLITILVVWILVRAWRAKEKFAGLLLLSFGITVLFSLHDFARGLGFPSAPVEFGALSFVLLILAQTYVLAQRFAESYDRIKALSSELEVAHTELQKTHQETLEELEEVRRMGNYELEERLGVGGMGEVWKASHRLLARAAAIKLIRPEKFDDNAEEALGRFEREAQATAQLRSPHTVELYDFGQSPRGEFYYAMELLDGMDLSGFVKQYGPMSPARVIHVLQQACLSLAEAHNAGLVHRDIKPHNLYLCRMGEQYDFIKILDFGLVKPLNIPDEWELTKEQALANNVPEISDKDSASNLALKEVRSAPDSDPKTDSNSSSSGGKIRLSGSFNMLTVVGAVTGTPSFMPPEQIGNEDIDGRADLYALGCVAYWLLSGKLVFQSNNVINLLYSHQFTEPDPVSEASKQSIPEELATLVHQCLAKKPEDRPQSAKAILVVLEQLAKKHPWTNNDAQQWWETHKVEQKITK